VRLGSRPHVRPTAPLSSLACAHDLGEEKPSPLPLPLSPCLVPRSDYRRAAVAAIRLVRYSPGAASTRHGPAPARSLPLARPLPTCPCPWCGPLPVHPCPGARHGRRLTWTPTHSLVAALARGHGVVSARSPSACVPSTRFAHRLPLRVRHNALIFAWVMYRFVRSVHTVFVCRALCRATIF
jgi:hypothetical protein